MLNILPKLYKTVQFNSIQNVYVTDTSELNIRHPNEQLAF